MRSHGGSGCGTAAFASTNAAIAAALAWLLVLGGGAAAQTSKAQKSKTGQQTTAQQPYENFDNKKFSNSTKIDNQWLPLTPGEQRIYDGFSMEGKTRAPRKLVLTVTDLSKVIDGVRTLVVWGTDYSAGKLTQNEILFYAQADDGTVWFLGEYPEEFEGGKLDKTPAWLHGREQARAGIVMPAEPRPGMPSYSLGWAPAVRVSDRGKVDQTGVKNCVRAGCYDDVLVIAESNKSEPNVEQLRYYARGVGNVRVGGRGKGEKAQETLELTEIAKLTPDALAKARAAALELDQRAYRLTKKVYDGTPPAEPITAGR